MCSIPVCLPCPHRALVLFDTEIGPIGKRPGVGVVDGWGASATVRVDPYERLW